jgi:hypothetical protein
MLAIKHLLLLDTLPPQYADPHNMALVGHKLGFRAEMVRM